VSTRDDLADVMARQSRMGGTTWHSEADTVLAHLAERGMVVLGPDGEPLRIVEALRLLAWWASERKGGRHTWLTMNGLSSELADACLAAAEVEG
jgi:hypothetical protein